MKVFKKNGKQKESKQKKNVQIFTLSTTIKKYILENREREIERKKGGKLILNPILDS